MQSLAKLLQNLLLSRVNKGTVHWINQRVGSLALIPLTIVFIFTFVQHIGLEYDKVVVVYKNPFRALLTLSFFSLTLLHFKQGAQVVIEDYVSDGKTNKLLLLMNTIAFWGLNLCIFLALARIMFST